jgi:hypothetical protein
VAAGPTSGQRLFWETSLLGRGNNGEQALQTGNQEYQQYASQNQILSVIDIVAERQQHIYPME